jgi:prolyl 4-hydroxylase
MTLPSRLRNAWCFAASSLICKPGATPASSCGAIEPCKKWTLHSGAAHCDNFHMSTQIATPELKQWIVDQARAGHEPEAVLKAMIASGWDDDLALATLEQALDTHLTKLQRQAVAPEVKRVPLPEPDLAGSPCELSAADCSVRVVASMHNPRVVVFAGLLTHEECDQIVELARPRMARSETVDIATGGSEINSARTSRGMFFARGEFDVIARVEARLAALLNWPVENGEGLQVLHYLPGAEYKPHYDYFDPAQSGTPTILPRGGPRGGPGVMNRTPPARGGGTTFPDVDLEVAPVKGHAVFFSYDSPHPSTRTLHGGAPVLAGEKWVATKWMRTGRFD